MLTWLRDRLRAMRFDPPELSGGLGDLGTFVPLMVSLIIVCGMEGGSVLFFAGLANVLVGLAFNQPIPVQPMKAIAAVAIAEGLAPGEIAAAGFLSGAILLALVLTGLVTAAERWIPRPVVLGIQLGVGLKLAAKGVTMALAGGWWDLDGRVLALAAALLVLVTARAPRFPSALILLVAGIVLIPLEGLDSPRRGVAGLVGTHLDLAQSRAMGAGSHARGAAPASPHAAQLRDRRLCALR